MSWILICAVSLTYITLHYITLHYITLHYITYIYIYIHIYIYTQLYSNVYIYILYIYIYIYICTHIIHETIAHHNSDYFRELRWGTNAAGKLFPTLALELGNGSMAMAQRCQNQWVHTPVTWAIAKLSLHSPKNTGCIYIYHISYIYIYHI